MPSRSAVDEILGAVRTRARAGRLSILCFGASVTEQAHGNGFFDYLPQSLAAQMPDVAVRLDRLFFGASGLDDAGFFHAGRAAAARPDICLLDWHTGTSERFDDARYASMLTTLLDAGVLPVQVIFPKADGARGDRPNVLQARYFERASGLPLIDLRDFFGTSPEDLSPYFRDVVHTTPDGARLYARLLAGELRRLLHPPSERLVQVVSAGPPIDGPFMIDWTARPVTLQRGGELVVDLEAPLGGVPFDLHAEVLVGPFSPVLAVAMMSGGGERTSVGEACIWDVSCHYVRLAHKPVVDALAVPRAGPFSVSVTLAETVPPYETCRRKGFSFEGDRILPVMRLMSAGARLVSARLVAVPEGQGGMRHVGTERWS